MQLPEGYQGEILPAEYDGLCYEVTAELKRRDPSLIRVKGEVGVLMRGGKVWYMPHYWLLNNGKIFDPTKGQFTRGPYVRIREYIAHRESNHGV